MKLAVNRTTRKDNNEQLQQKFDISISKIITKSNSHQIKYKQNKLTYTLLEKICHLSSID